MSRRTPPKIAPKGCQKISLAFDRQREHIEKQTVLLVECPVCGRSVKEQLINFHLDECLQMSKKDLQDSASKMSSCSSTPSTSTTSLLAAKKRKRGNLSQNVSKKSVMHKAMKTCNVNDSGSDGDDFQESSGSPKWKMRVKLQRCKAPNHSKGQPEPGETAMDIPSVNTESIPEEHETLVTSTTSTPLSNGRSCQSDISISYVKFTSPARGSSIVETSSSTGTNITYDLSETSSPEDVAGGSNFVSGKQMREKRKSKRSLMFNGYVPVANEFTHKLLAARKLPRCIAEHFYGQDSDLICGVESQSISQEPDSVIEAITYSPSNIDNLLKVCKSVLDDPSNESLFNDEDMKWLKIYYSQSESAQKLYVRLFQRKFKWFPLKHLMEMKFFEDVDLETVLAELTRSEMLISSEWLTDLETALRLLFVPTLKKLCNKSLNLKDEGKKDEIIQRILKHVKTQPPVQWKNSSLTELVVDQVKKEIGECYKLNTIPREVLRRVLTLYNLVAVDDDDALEKSPLTKLTLVNMEKVAYPDYEINTQRKIFRNREDLLRYVNASSIATEIALHLQDKSYGGAITLSDEALKQFTKILNDEDILSHDKSLPRFLRRFTAGHVLAKCLFLRVEALQKTRIYMNAVEQLKELLKQEVYGLDSRGTWYNRMALNLDMHLKNKDDALRAIIAGLCDDNTRSDHLLSLCKRGDKLSKTIKDSELVKEYRAVRPKIELMQHQKATIVGRKAPSGIPGYKSAFIGKNGILFVEDYALEHYAELGYSEGIHGEGSTIVSIFGLLLWDIIYTVDIPDAFRTPHQSFPLDLYTDEFYCNRHIEINERVKFISSTSIEVLLSEVQDIWEQHKGEVSVVNWNIFGDVSKVQSLMRCMGNEFLAKLCEKLAGEYRNCRGGVPDLVVWNPQDLRWMMVEVKGPTDMLSDKQRMWLDFLIRSKVKVEVLSVTDKVSKRLAKGA